MPVTSLTSAQFVYHISEQNHAMAGAVIAQSSAQAAALGQACLRISLELGAAVAREKTDDPIKKLDQIKRDLLDLCDRDAGAIAEYVALREAGKTLAGQQILCQTPADIGRLSLEAAAILQSFRPHVNDRVQDDLEMSISLLASTAQAAMLLLDSNLRIWPDKELLIQFEPVREKLEKGVKGVDLRSRIRSP